MNWYKISNIMNGIDRNLNYNNIGHIDEWNLGHDNNVILWWYDNGVINTEKAEFDFSKEDSKEKYVNTHYKILGREKADLIPSGRFEVSTKKLSLAWPYDVKNRNFWHNESRKEHLYKLLYKKFGSDIFIYTFY